MQSLFGTDGIRGNVSSPLFSQTSLTKIGYAIGAWTVHHYGHRPTVIIGYDTRYSAQTIKQSLIAGLMSLPVDVLDAHIIPTPAAAHLLRLMPHVATAIIISASHNWAEDNGIKLFDQKHGKLTLVDEQEITAYYYESSIPAETSRSGSMFPLTQGSQQYAQHIYTEMRHITPWVKHKTIHVVLDAAHGATAHLATQLFEKLGMRVTTLHNQPDGYNINKLSGSTHPQVLQEAVIHHKADIGFAFDGDGDRIIAVNRHGHIKNGDDLLCLLLDHPDYKAATSVVGTIMTNGGLEYHLAQRNVSLLRTPVGDRFIMELLNREQLLLGGEPVGHIILRNHLYTGDGLLVALKVLETIMITHNWDMVTFTPHAHVTEKMVIQTRHDLSQEPFASIIHNARKSLPYGRVIVRYSGTEPVLRIAVEAETISQAQHESAILINKLQHAFKELS